MRTCFLRKHTERLSLRAGQLIQSEGEEEEQVHPICCLESVAVYGNAQITTQAIKECLKEGVKVNYFSSTGRYLGRLEPGYPKNVRRRMEQYRLYFDGERRLSWCKALLTAKVRGELVELRRQKEQGRGFPYSELRERLREGLRDIERASSVSELLGIEGRSARAYYEMFSHVLPEGVVWRGRSYHPTRDGVNTLLSCVYGICAQMYREWIEHWSLDPHCGFLHEPGYGGGGLAYDLLEIQRATFCDHLALRLMRRDAVFTEVARCPDGKPLGEELFFLLGKMVREAMEKHYRLQKESPLEQLKRIVEMTVKGMEGEGGAPDYAGIQPER